MSVRSLLSEEGGFRTLLDACRGLVGFRVWGLGLGTSDSRLRVQGVTARAWCGVHLSTWKVTFGACQARSIQDSKKFT